MRLLQASAYYCKQTWFSLLAILLSVSIGTSDITAQTCITSPVITCPPIYYGCLGDDISPEAIGFATALPGDANCPQPEISYEDVISSGSVCGEGTIVKRLWTAIYPNNTNPWLFAECTQVMVLKDNSFPIIENCPTDISVTTDGDCRAIVSWTPPTANDDCGLLGFTSNYGVGSAFYPGTTQVIYTATDNCGNMTTCSFNIIVTDNCCNDTPSLTIPNDFVGCPSSSTLPATTGQATATLDGNSCGAPVITYVDEVTNHGDCSGETLISRVWTATNPGNTNATSSGIQWITLSDNTAPTISNCPANINIVTNANCLAVVSWNTPAVFDNCGVLSFASDVASGTAFEVGLHTVTYTARDNCGNTSSCSFTINVIANCCDGAPSIQVPTTYKTCLGGSTDPSITGSATGSISGDNCVAPTITYTDAVTNSSCGQTIQRTWRAVNPNYTNQVTTGIQVINLVDEDAPVITGCPSDITVTSSSNCQAVVNWTAPTATDDCGVQSLVSNYNPGTAFAPGVYTVTYTATDNCGRTSNCSFTLTVIANCCDGAPSIQVPASVSACLGGSSDPSITGTATGTISGSGCSAATITYSDAIATSTCGNIITRTWKATNPNYTNQFTTGVQTISLQDDTAPVISNCPINLTVTSSSNCQAVVNWVAPTATDNCGLQSLTSNYNPGSAFAPGVYNIVYTATDNCGRTSSCSFTLTVVANCCDGAPVLNLPATYSGCTDGSTNPSTTGFATAIISGNGCAAPTVTYTDQVSNQACGKVITRTWRAVNPNYTNQVTTGIQTLDFSDDVDPMITNCPTDIVVSSNADCFAIVNWAIPSASDNCNLISFTSDRPTGSGSRFDLGNTKITYTAIDACGNTATCSFNVIVTGNCCSDEMIVTCPPAFTGCPGSSTDPSVTGSATANASTDCPADITYFDQIISQGSCTSGVVIDRYWVATRTGSAESDTCIQRISTVDTQAPVITSCVSDVTLAYANRTYTWTDPTVSESCGTIVTYSTPKGTTFPVGTTDIRVTVRDNCGNVITCDFSVTVQAQNNSAGLFVTCPDDILLSCGAGQSGSVPVPQVSSDCELCNGGEIAGFVYMGERDGSRYYCSKEQLTWPEAQAFCVANGGNLATINNAGENQFLAGILEANSAYIGLSDADNEGHFAWTDGSPVTYSKWYPNQPNNYNNYQDYVELLRNGYWNDQYNNKPLEFIMEVSCINITQTAGPTDLSDVGQNTTVTYSISDACGNTKTCSYNITVSGDLTFACPDDVEVHTGDNYEVVYFESPEFETCCTSCNQGSEISGFVYMGQRDGSYYYCSKDKRTWQDANRISRANGGNLAIIESAQENSFLASKLGNQIAFIGVSDHAEEGVWRNCNGKRQGYFNWRSGNPNNHQGIQHYVELEPSGAWNDNDGTYKREYIMEVKGCGKVRQTAGIPSGGEFPIGTTTVSFEASDDCGNVKTCSFDVVVIADANSQSAYCASNALSSSRAFINKVQVNNLLFSTGNNGGYKDNTARCIPLMEGGSFDLTVHPGWGYYRYYAYYTIFVDYNGDGDFDDAHEYVGKARSANIITGNLTVPYGAVKGKTRMRIAMSLSGYPNSCGANYYGETEDFCVDIRGNTSDPAAKGGGRKNNIAKEVSFSDVKDPGATASLKKGFAAVFPNPATDRVKLTAEHLIRKMSIFASDGRIVKKINRPSGWIDVSDLAPGLYMVRLIDDAGLEITEKIIIR